MAEFGSPDWRRPLDLEERLAKVPAEATAKGLLFRRAIAAAAAAGGEASERKEYAPLSSYPVRELLEVLSRAASIAHPDLSPREGLRRLGRDVFAGIREHPAGRLLFSIAGSSFPSAVKLVDKAYRLFSASSANVIEQGPTHVIVQVHNAWTFPDCYHYGVFEGAMQAYHQEGELLVRVRSLSDVEFHVSWPS